MQEIPAICSYGMQEKPAICSYGMQEKPTICHRGPIYRVLSRFIGERLPCTKPARTVPVWRLAFRRDGGLIMWREVPC